MSRHWDRWAILLLTLFSLGTLSFAYITNYDLITLDSEFLNQSKLYPGCTERVSGQIKLKKAVEGAKLLVTLEHVLADGGDHERSVLVTNDRYTLTVRGQPASEKIWTLHAYYFNKEGQLGETSQQFEHISCDQSIAADLEL